MVIFHSYVSLPGRVSIMSKMPQLLAFSRHHSSRQVLPPHMAIEENDEMMIKYWTVGFRANHHEMEKPPEMGLPLYSYPFL